jgi:Peptidase family M28
VPPLDETMRQLLAAPREAGTPAAAAARDLVARHLEALGYRVERQRFRFAPSAPLGLPVFGAGLGALGLVLLAALTGTALPGWAALLLLAGGLAAVTMLAVGVGLGWVPIGGAAREDANLIATRGTGPVRRWIVAHLDTKAQAQSMAGRLVAVWFVMLAIAVLIGLAVTRLWGPLPLAAAAGGAAVAVLAGALTGGGRLRGGSPGARDNGTGLAGALAAAEANTASNIGILITGAEEFGLVGARIFVAERSGAIEGSVIVNLDTIDQEGQLAMVSHDARGMQLARQLAPGLDAVGLPIRLRRLPLGILTDSVPFARRGLPALTIGRLTWRTLRLIHTPADTADGLSLDTAIRIGRAVAAN